MVRGRLASLSPDVHVAVKLYWHCWNLKSGFLEDFTDPLIQRAVSALPG